jgi:hypothetical protein
MYEALNLDYSKKAWLSLRWLPTLAWQLLSRHGGEVPSVHLIIAVADHFEPAFVLGGGCAQAELKEQEQRLELWCSEYPKAVSSWVDSDGQTFRHTYFYPAEQYQKPIVERLAEHCQAGWGEIEVHLHHGVDMPDSRENMRSTITTFRDRLAALGCLSETEEGGPARFAFVHGNWALANIRGGPCCGVDDELQVLADLGCYADFTLPSFPDPSQTAKINSIYECALPLARRAPHRRGKDLRVGQPPEKFPVIVQGPLLLDLNRKIRGLPFPRFEYGDLTDAHPPTAARLKLWRRMQITVRGRKDWIFIKLHCHGMDPRDRSSMHGGLLRSFLQQMDEVKKKEGIQLHYVTAREMFNIVLAACDGREGSPGDFRDYRLIKRK